jgi:hypothetical protein
VRGRAVRGTRERRHHWIAIAVIAGAIGGTACADASDGRPEAAVNIACGDDEQLFVESYTYDGDDSGFRSDPRAAISDTFPEEQEAAFEVVSETRDTLIMSDGKITVELEERDDGFRVLTSSRCVVAHTGDSG